MELDLARPAWFLVFFALLLTASLLAERLVEVPARRWIIERWRGGAQTVARRAATGDARR